MSKVKKIEAEDVERLREIQSEMMELVSEANGLIRGTGIIWDRARSYWLAQMEMGLSDEHDYVGSSGVNMEDTINEMESRVEGDDEENENDD